MDIFGQFAIVLTLSSLIGWIVLKARLPLVTAYLIAGVVLSLIVSHFAQGTLGIFSFLPDLGIAFVLFLIGMELDLRELKTLGKPIIISSLGQIFITTLAGYAISGYLGFSQVASIYLGLGLSFSSTLVVIKLLLEKRDLTSLYGKLSLGIALVEDLVAITALMLISINSVGQLNANSLGLVLVLVAKAVGLFLLTFLLSRYILEKIFDAVAKSVELLFLTAIAWCFVFTSLAVFAQFSVVVGAFLAGVALASSPYHLQIQGKVKPLRDFFVTLFFVFLGSQVRLADVFSSWQIILILTGYALVMKPIIFLLLLGMFGFRKHTLFQTALNLSQISEFSLVILLVGVNAGIVPSNILSIMATIAVISIIISSINISFSKKIYQLFSPFMGFFEHSKNTHYIETKLYEQMDEHVIIIGAHRVGRPVVEFLTHQKIPFIVMDFNPHVVDAFRKRGINVIYGDAGDIEILENLRLERAKLIISTIADTIDNEIFLSECKRLKARAKIIIRALDDEHAKILKKLGADYIIFPEQVSGDFLATELKTHWTSQHFKGLEALKKLS